MVYDVYKCQYVFEDTDTDNEKLTDTYEFFLETDKNKIDTDSDDLTDYAEIFLTGTDPLYKDSDEYNSNSYAKGLLNAAGINDLGGPEMFQVLVGGSDPYMANTEIPGYEYPVPKKYFGLS